MRVLKPVEAAGDQAGGERCEMAGFDSGMVADKDIKSDTDENAQQGSPEADASTRQDQQAHSAERQIGL
jgi:membrane protease subunit (stomatin/prohibitin family)